MSLTRSENQAVLSVTDTGPGIPAENLPYIFDRFYRVDKARSRAMGGSGLGLSIAKWVTEAHHGSIEVKSELNQGTTFTIKLPALPETFNYTPEKAAKPATNNRRRIPFPSLRSSNFSLRDNDSRE
jgi:signal transduction histidine kinase